MRWWRHTRAALAFPVLVTVLVPAVILAFTGADPADGAGGLARTLAGALLALLGLALLVWTVTLFDRKGDGTLAPFDPPRRLVVHGPYRHVRNPMISGVTGIVLGESVMAGSWWIALWGLVFLGVNLSYIRLKEEPALARRFQDDYLRYQDHVHRWVPRLRPWGG